jgi:hypothetical protein
MKLLTNSKNLSSNPLQRIGSGNLTLKMITGTRMKWSWIDREGSRCRNYDAVPDPSLELVRILTEATVPFYRPSKKYPSGDTVLLSLR